MSSERKNWTDEDWAAQGYVLVVIREKNGTEDPVYIKRRYASPVITRHEWSQIQAAAKRQHLVNVRKKFKDIERYRQTNYDAVRPYRLHAERLREERRRRDVESGSITLDQMTFFDLL